MFNYPFPFQTQANATLEFWVNPTSTGGEEDILWATVGGGDTNRFLISLNGNVNGNLTGYTYLNYRDPSGTAHALGNTTTKLPYGEWTYLAFVKKGSTYSIYVNDRLTNYTTMLESQVTDSSPNLPTSTGWTVNGRAVEGPYGCCQFAGLLDEMRISNIALNPSEFLVAP